MASSAKGTRKVKRDAVQARARKATKTTATRAAAKAPRRGRADRGAMTRHEKALRDSAIIAAKHAGVPPKQIAREWGITERSVFRVISDFAEMTSPLDQQPLTILDELLRIYQRQMLDFARAAAVYAEGNPNASMGAMKAGAEATERYIALLVRLGKLPRELQTFRAESEVRHLLMRMVDVLEDVAQGRLSGADAQEIFVGLLQQGQRPADVEGRELPPGEAA